MSVEFWFLNLYYLLLKLKQILNDKHINVIMQLPGVDPQFFKW